MRGKLSNWWRRPIRPTRRNRVIGGLLGGGGAFVLLSLPSVLLAPNVEMRTVGWIGIGLDVVLALVAYGLWRFWPADQARIAEPGQATALSSLGPVRAGRDSNPQPPDP